MNDAVLDDSVAPYDPAFDAATRWPDWQFLTTPLRGVTTEILSPSKRTVLIDQDWWDADPDGALAHQVAHLDLGHHLDMGRPFTADDEARAASLSKTRILMGVR